MPDEKQCLTIEIEPTDISEVRETIIPLIEELKPEDYFFLFYDPKFKIGLVNITKEEFEPKLNQLKEDGKIKDYLVKDNETEFDISKILACASRKITEYLEEKLETIEVDSIVNELVSLPEINADAYAPLHFILNQLRVLDKESEIRHKMKTNPNYLRGYKQVQNIIVR